jgi:branched-chain amino acid transport system substrate-binding protein
MKSRFLAGGLAFGLIGCLLTACGSAANSGGTGGSGTTTSSTIPVGIIEDLSGPDSGIAASSVPGIKLAVQQINQEGLNVGGTSHKLNLIVCDAQSQSTVAASCAQKLVSEDHVVALFGTQYPDGASTIAVSQRAGIIQFTATDAADPELTAKGNCCLLIAYGPSPSNRDKLMVETTAELAEAANPSYKTMALLMPNIAVFHTIVNDWVSVAGSLGLKVVAVKYYTEGITDFSGILTSLSESHPDIIFAGSGNPVDDGAILREALNLGVGKVFSFPGIGTDIVQSTVGHSISSAVVVPYSGTAFDPSILAKYPAVATFVSQMTAYLGGKLPAENPTGTLVYYDTLKMWAQAVEQAGCVPAQGSNNAAGACMQKVMHILLTMTYTGVSGTRHYDAGHYMVMPVDVCEVINGRTSCKAYTA